MIVTARMVCNHAQEHETYNPETCQIDVGLHAIGSEHPEASNYSKYTPWSNYEMMITNPAIKGFFKHGEIYDITITPHVKES